MKKSLLRTAIEANQMRRVVVVNPTKERPILFSGEMVRAILDGRKTQTRRIFSARLLKALKAAIELGEVSDFLTNGKLSKFDLEYLKQFSPYGQVGDRLWVRENFLIDHANYYPRGPLPKVKPEPSDDVPFLTIYFQADGSCCQQIPECECGTEKTVWRPSIHMPRRASRINLEITNIRVERLNDISDADSIAEGVTIKSDAQIASHFIDGIQTPAQLEYFALWESINGSGSWDKNPWVWVVEFKKL